jgi:hypothetical protein
MELALTLFCLNDHMLLGSSFERPAKISANDCDRCGGVAGLGRYWG